MPNGNIDNKALDSLIDPKGNVVLEQFEDSAYGTTAVLLRPESKRYQQETGLGDPYVVAYGYDMQTGEWSHGFYTADLSYAVERANPEVLDELTVKWQREDFEATLEKDGYDPDKDNVDALILSCSESMEAWKGSAIADGNETIENAVRDGNFERDPELALDAMLRRTEGMRATKAWPDDIKEELDQLEHAFFSPKDGLYFTAVHDADTDRFEGIDAFCITAPELLDEVDKDVFPGMTAGEIDAQLIMQPKRLLVGTEEFDRIVESLAKADGETIELDPHDDAYETLTAALGKMACWEDFKGSDDERIQEAADKYAKGDSKEKPALDSIKEPKEYGIDQMMADLSDDIPGIGEDGPGGRD